jgi:PAS domain S-box-containing protein
MSDEGSTRSAGPSDAPLLEPLGRILSGVSPELLADIVEHIAHPVFVKDREFRFVLVNRAFCELLGRQRPELIGRTDYDFFPESESDFFRRVDERVFATGRPISIDEEPITDASGHTHRLQTAKAPLVDGDGGTTHLVGIINDVTQLKAVEDALRAANEELERTVEERSDALRDAQQALLRKERLAVLGQLAGGLAHQIRNPLAAMATAAAILRKKLGEHADDDVRQALTVIREEVWEANRIITDLLDYARVKPPSRGDVPVEALLAAALEHAKPPPEVVVAWDVDDGLVVSVDERQMRDALGNVVRNAIEAMAGHGTLKLSAHADDEGTIIGVEDSGPGLTRASIAQLFEPLVTSKPLGLGLGLSTARALVENQGGTIRYATQRGSGARFEIRVPAPEPEER